MGSGPRAALRRAHRRQGRVVDAQRVQHACAIRTRALRHDQRSAGPEEPAMPAINLAAKLSMFDGYWQPRVVGQFNGHDLLVVKVKGEFVWHRHDDTDDFFFVLQGRITISMHESDVTLGPGEEFVVPKGIEHCPVVEEEAHVLLIEASGTPNTGDPATAQPRRVI
jgi:mannose-6-phosphate isomerase-like protein (cupin superfamily)